MPLLRFDYPYRRVKVIRTGGRSLQSYNPGEFQTAHATGIAIYFVATLPVRRGDSFDVPFNGRAGPSRIDA